MLLGYCPVYSRRPLMIMVYGFLLFVVCSVQTVKPKQCIVVVSDDFTCSKNKLNPYTAEYFTRPQTTAECKVESLCRGNMNITYDTRQLYNEKVFKQFSKMVDGCCGRCTSYQVTRNITKLEQINEEVINTSDIIFPVIARKSGDRLYGFYYIPMFDVPSAYYFTHKETDREKLTKLIEGCLSTWPLIVICLLLAFISGFIVWLMEKKDNRSEFPKPFLKGLSEAFWWSFVSMTTVGYGDKIPRSLPARFFAVSWILLGITIFSLLTGSLTNKINQVNTYKVPSLYGKRVGGLFHRLHDATLVAQHGGVFIGVEYNDSVSGIADLMVRLERREIDGFIVSRPTYYHFSLMVREHPEYFQKYSYKINKIKMEMNEKKLLKEILTIGFLIKSEEKYDYFRKYFEDNWLQIQNRVDFDMNYQAKQIEPDTSISHFEGYFYPVFYVISALLATVCCYGILEGLWKRNRYNRYLKSQTSGESDSVESANHVK